MVEASDSENKSHSRSGRPQKPICFHLQRLHFRSSPKKERHGPSSARRNLLSTAEHQERTRTCALKKWTRTPRQSRRETAHQARVLFDLRRWECHCLHHELTHTDRACGQIRRLSTDLKLHLGLAILTARQCNGPGLCCVLCAGDFSTCGGKLLWLVYRNAVPLLSHALEFMFTLILSFRGTTNGGRSV